jgi:hypothetical protein
MTARKLGRIAISRLSRADTTTSRSLDQPNDTDAQLQRKRTRMDRRLSYGIFGAMGVALM